MGKILIILIMVIIIFDIAIIICGRLFKRPTDRARDDEGQVEFILNWKKEHDKKSI